MKYQALIIRGLAVVMALALGACAAAETAGQITIGGGDLNQDGEPDVPILETRIDWPAIDELVKLDDDQVGGIPGVPTEFGYGTFAHLQGALRLSGECQVVVPFTSGEINGGEDPKPGEESNLMRAEFRILSCMADPVSGEPMPGCAEECGEFLGLRFETQIDVKILSEDDAKAVVGLAEEQGITVTPEAIVQIRMRFFELSVFQGDYDPENGVGQVDVSCTSDEDCASAFQCQTGFCACRASIESCKGDTKQKMLDPEVDLMEKISGFEFALTRTQDMANAEYQAVIDNLEFCNFACGEEQECDILAEPPVCIPAKNLTEEVLVVDSVSVKTISPYTPQRYDLASDSDIITEIKKNITNKKGASISLIQRLHIEQEHLYEVSFQGGGLYVKVQPEVVVSALEIAKSSFL